MKNYDRWVAVEMGNKLIEPFIKRNYFVSWLCIAELLCFFHFKHLLQYIYIYKFGTGSMLLFVLDLLTWRVRVESHMAWQLIWLSFTFLIFRSREMLCWKEMGSRFSSLSFVAYNIWINIALCQKCVRFIGSNRKSLKYVYLFPHIFSNFLWFRHTTTPKSAEFSSNGIMITDWPMIIIRKWNEKANIDTKRMTEKSIKNLIPMTMVQSHGTLNCINVKNFLEYMITNGTGTYPK